MMNGMPAQQAPDQEAAPAAEGQESAGGGVTELVTGIQAQMLTLLKLLSQSQGIPPQAKQQLAQIIAQYRDFVQSNLGEGGASEQGPAPQANTAPEVGANPNARPM